MSFCRKLRSKNYRRCRRTRLDISSYWSLKSYNSQHAYVKFHIIQTALTYSSIILQPAHVNEMPITAELTVS